jgi:hypothetical protein
MRKARSVTPAMGATKRRLARGMWAMRTAKMVVERRCCKRRQKYSGGLSAGSRANP